MFDSPPSSFSRREWLGILARAKGVEIARLLEGVSLLPGFIYLRAPEAGMAMVRGRMGGSGAPFNLGEMSVARCSIRDAAGRVGHGYAKGRDLKQVELIARLDAVLQDAAFYPAYAEAVVKPLAVAQAAARAEVEARAAATEVKFFTMAAMRS